MVSMLHSFALRPLILAALVLALSGSLLAGPVSTFSISITGEWNGSTTPGTYTGGFTTAGICDEYEQVNCDLATFALSDPYGEGLTDTSQLRFTEGPDGPQLTGQIGAGCAFGACWHDEYFNQVGITSCGTAAVCFVDWWSGPVWHSLSPSSGSGAGAGSGSGAGSSSLVITLTSPDVGAAPEPSVCELAGAGLLGMAALRRYRGRPRPR
jgi:hypothetical protein